MFSVKDELVTFGAKIAGNFLAEENECENFTVLRIINPGASRVKGRQRTSESYLGSAPDEEGIRVHAVFYGITNKRDPMEDGRWFSFVSRKPLMDKIDDDGSQDSSGEPDDGANHHSHGILEVEDDRSIFRVLSIDEKADTTSTGEVVELVESTAGHSRRSLSPL